MAGKTSGTVVKDKDGFDFHVTKWETTGKEGDKGKRESSDYVAKGGGWVKDTSTTHTTDQNKSKGSPERHK